MFKKDYELFNRYNATLWSAISITPNFTEELSHFRSLLEKVYNFCGEVKKKTMTAIKHDKLAEVLDSQVGLNEISFINFIDPVTRQGWEIVCLVTSICLFV